MAKKQTKQPRDEMLRVLVTADQKRKLTAAAEQAGLSLSSWLLSVALRETAS